MVAKGDWGVYEKGKVQEYGEFVGKAGKFVYGREPPWISNPGRRGQPAKNDPRSLVICLTLKIWLGKPYRDLVSFLSGSRFLWSLIGLECLPGRMDLQRAMNRLTRGYLDDLNRFIIEEGYYSKKEEGRRSVLLTARASR